MHARRRHEKIACGPGANKTMMLGLRDRATGKVYAQVLIDPPFGYGATFRSILRRHASPGTEIHTDESLIYRKVLNRRSVNHSRGVYVIGDVTTNGVESFWALFKRIYVGTHHDITPQHLNRYVSEATFRYNRRDAPLLDRLADTAALMGGGASPGPPSPRRWRMRSSTARSTVMSKRKSRRRPDPQPVDRDVFNKATDALVRTVLPPSEKQRPLPTQ